MKAVKALANATGKHTDRKKAVPNALKRPGSPNLSEASGTETPRKKQKKLQVTSSQSQAIKPVSRSTSPLPPQPSSSVPTSEPNRFVQAKPRTSTAAALSAEGRKSSNSRPDGKRQRSYAGSGSERDTAGSGGEGSDGTRKKLMLKFSKSSSKNVTPLTSRAGSPDPRSGDAADKGHAPAGNASIGNVPGSNVSIGNAPAGPLAATGRFFLLTPLQPFPLSQSERLFRLLSHSIPFVPFVGLCVRLECGFLLNGSYVSFTPNKE